MNKKGIFFLLLAYTLFNAPAYGGEAMETVRVHVEKVLTILRDPALKAELAKGVEQKKIQSVYQEMFDEVELSKRALGRHWNTLSREDRKEFVPLFRRLLEQAYLDKILAYSNEKILFDKEISLSPTIAEVRTRIVSSSQTVFVFYRVIQKKGSWKVYDVIVENISLVQNYRSQFNEILAKNSPSQMLQILRNKVK